MRPARIALIQQMPIFGAIGGEAIEFLLEPAPVVDVPAGAYFFRENDAANCMYVLEAGQVTVSKSWQGHELLLRRLQQGDCFGEMALLDLFPRSATVRADSDCSAIELSSANLYRLFEHDAVQFALIQMNIAREMSRRLRVTDDLLFRARMGEVLEAHEPLFPS
ncbi:MAG: cyclic nucleotide-binding domain-containing protein [Gammaproteobacteria bacterium]|nr:cyclic nucleotide-binding domain-containing protein [Gammaproteobacteria bacterium]MBU1530550.1 cyclic nucleotide-binding domain-containing protein [Gammaproteobacteria bacterium]MBU2285285.1 cyclic nucleotide-binding domain-containing protein [Gammaproteobacteria bacterium]